MTPTASILMPPFESSPQVPRLVTVSIHSDPIEAHILRCRLEAEEIPSFIVNEHHIRMNWLMSNALGGVLVQVPKQFTSQALSVIKDIEAGTYEIRDEEPEAQTCPKCGSHEALPDKVSWRIAFLAFFLLNVPVPYSAHVKKCLNCGYRGSESEF